MATVLAIGVVSVFVALAMVHVYWALGGGKGKVAAVPEVTGRPAFTPSSGATLAVALALLGAALLVAAAIGWVRSPISTHVLSFLLFGLALVFLARAVGEFRLMGFFKRVRGTAFARLDSLVFSPLCLLLGLAIFWLAIDLVRAD